MKEIVEPQQQPARDMAATSIIMETKDVFPIVKDRRGRCNIQQASGSTKVMRFKKSIQELLAAGKFSPYH